MIIVLYCIVLKGWSLLPNELRPFQDLLCSREFRYDKDVNMPIKFCSETYFFQTRLFNEPEITDSGPPACAQDFYVLNLGSRGEHVTQRPPRQTV